MRTQRDKDEVSVEPWPPRYLRLRSAAKYLGMSKGKFMSMVQPHVPALKGARHLAFDRLELDAWMESHCGRGGHPTSEDVREAAPRGTPGNLRSVQRDPRRVRKLRRTATRRILRNVPGHGHEDKRIFLTLPLSHERRRAQLESAQRSDA